MKTPFSATPQRVTHSVSTSPSPKSIPSTSARKPSQTTPAPLAGGNARKSRCASCGGGRGHF